MEISIIEVTTYYYVPVIVTLRVRNFYPCFTDEGTEVTDVNLIFPKVLEREGDSN